MLAARALFLGVVLTLLSALPASAQTAPQQRGETATDVLFVLDSSASMSRDDDRGRASDPQRLRISAVRAFIALATPRMRIGLVNLSDEYSPNNGMDKPTPLQTGLVQPLTEASATGKAQLLAVAGDVKTSHEAGLDDGFTYMSKALDLSRRVLEKSNAPQRYLIVLTDGDVTGEDPRAWWAQTQQLQASGIKVVLFRLGQREPPGMANDELAALNEALAPGGGAARVAERPEDLLSYYLQTFTVLSADTYVNQIGPMKGGAEQPLMAVQDWMDVSDAYVLVPGAKVKTLVSDKLGRDVAKDARSEIGDDPNLTVLSLSRERLGQLEGNWRLALDGDASNVQLVFRSRVAIKPDTLLQPKGAEGAVVSVALTPGAVPIKDQRLLARGADGEEPRPLLLGALGQDRYSGVVRPDRDGYYRVRVVGPQQTQPPYLEKTFAVPTTDKVALDEIGLGFERVTQEKLLKAGQALSVRATSDGKCALQGAALRVEAVYPDPPNGIAARETNAAATPAGQAQGGGLLYGFVPQAPGKVTFALDHSTVTCPGVPLPVGIPAGGRSSGVQTFDVDIERLLKVDRASPAALDTLPAGADAIDLALKYDMSSYKNEKLALFVQGLPGAAPNPPTIDLSARQGNARPAPRSGSVPVKVKFAGPQPGGAKGKLTLVVQQLDDKGGQNEIGRFDFSYEVAPGVLVARQSRDPQIGKDGVRVTLGYDPTRLAFPAVSIQEFDVGVEGLTSARVEPKILRAPPRKEMLEQTFFVQSDDVCKQTGTFKFSLTLKPVPSPNGDVVVTGAPIQVNVPMPQMAITLAAPERIGALRPGLPLPLTLQSTSLCGEAMKLRVTDPAHPDRFVDSGLSDPSAQLAPADGVVKTVEVVPERPAPRGESGTLLLQTTRVSGNPSTVYPQPIQLHYYNPLWTEEFPRTARNVFLAIAAAVTLLVWAPRVVADPILAHRAGDSSTVSGRKRFRWFLVSACLGLALSFAVVYWALARFMPQ